MAHRKDASTPVLGILKRFHERLGNNPNNFHPTIFQRDLLRKFLSTVPSQSTQIRFRGREHLCNFPSLISPEDLQVVLQYKVTGTFKGRIININNLSPNSKKTAQVNKFVANQLLYINSIRNSKGADWRTIISRETDLVNSFAADFQPILDFPRELLLPNSKLFSVSIGEDVQQSGKQLRNEPPDTNLPQDLEKTTLTATELEAVQRALIRLLEDVTSNTSNQGLSLIFEERGLILLDPSTALEGDIVMQFDHSSILAIIREVDNTYKIIGRAINYLVCNPVQPPGICGHNIYDLGDHVPRQVSFPPRDSVTIGLDMQTLQLLTLASADPDGLGNISAPSVPVLSLSGEGEVSGFS